MYCSLASKEYSYFEVKKILNNFNAKFPFLEPVNLGKSVAGRDIVGLKLGKCNQYVLYTSSFSGFDTLSTVFILRFLEEFCIAVNSGKTLCGVNIRNIAYKKGAICLPILNPDGYELKIKGINSAGHLKSSLNKTDLNTNNYSKNLRGVNLKYNFYKCNNLKSSENFGGYSPLSEPESIALASFLRKEKVKEVLTLCTLGKSGIYFKDNFKKGIKAAEVFSAVSNLPIIINESIGSLNEAYLNDKIKNKTLRPNARDFKYWVANEIKRPCFEIVQSNNDLSPEAAYSSIKEILTLFALCYT